MCLWTVMWEGTSASRRRRSRSCKRCRLCSGISGIRVRSESHPGAVYREHVTAGECRGVFDDKRRDGNTEQFEGLVGVTAYLSNERNGIFHCNTEHRFRRIHRGDFLYPVELTKSDEMIIVPVRPQDCVDMRRSLLEKLLAEIGR